MKSIRVLTWNIERGQQLENIISALKKENADVLLLQELDIFCGKRTQNANVPLRIATALNMRHTVFAKEFCEVGIHNGVDGTHGNAILSKLPIENGHSWNKTFSEQPCNLKQYALLTGHTRHGGRNFVACKIGNFLFYSVHAENFCNPTHRIKQIEELIRDAEQKMQKFGDTIHAVVIGGDLNTLSSGISNLLPCYFPKNIRTLLTHEPSAFATWIKQRFHADDPTFGQPTTSHALGLYKEKLDWLLMKKTEHGQHIQRSNDFVGGTKNHSDHRYICSTFSFT